MSSRLKSRYESQGFVIVPGLISPEDFTKLQQACDRVISLTRSGSWQHRRAMGKQFPPWADDDPDSWGVQHVMHPDLGEPVFARWYTSDALVRTAQELLECEEDELQMELFNLLINPTSRNFALTWHRDDVPPNATTEQEQVALNAWRYGTQWNTALYEDNCLYVVPGSHRTPRSPEQRKYSSDGIAPINPMDMPGAIRVTLEPGETLFYNNNILHCAVYDPNQRRATLHASMGNIRSGSTRARNILQHGLEWMKEPRFRDGLDERGKRMLERLIQLDAAVGRDVGFSLEG